MKKISIALKVIAFVIGIFCIPYGLLGFLGLNPAGWHEELWVRMAGLYMAILGCFYLYPNSKLKNKQKQIIYYSVTLSPFVVVIIAAIISVYYEGFHSFQITGGLNTVIVVSVCASFAPLSLLLHSKNERNF